MSKLSKTVLIVLKVWKDDCFAVFGSICLFFPMELANMKESTMTHRAGGSCSNNDLISALHVRQFNQYRGKMQQAEKSSLSAMHTASQCLLLARKKNLSHHAFIQSLPRLRTFSYSHFNSHIFPFTPVLTLPGEREKALPAANGKHFSSWAHGIYSKTSQLQML